MDQEMTAEAEMTNRKLEMEIQGCKVTMHFAEKPNLEVASRIKLALLGAAMPEAQSVPNS